MTSFVWRSRSLNWFYRWMRAIPLSPRGSNRDALRAAKQTLGRGEVLGVFPEGGISRDGLLMLGSPGAVSLVLGEEVPVVPCGIVGAHATLPFAGRRIRRHGVVVRFGSPLQPGDLVLPELPRKQRLAFATRRIMQEIARLSEQVAREDVLEKESPPG
jgi:1-acyl-sn-glycerol-3-phosphate acyltransferase